LVGRIVSVVWEEKRNKEDKVNLRPDERKGKIQRNKKERNAMMVRKGQ
jgi:hypothetical protein